METAGGIDATVTGGSISRFFCAPTCTQQVGSVQKYSINCSCSVTQGGPLQSCPASGVSDVTRDANMSMETY